MPNGYNYKYVIVYSGGRNDNVVLNAMSHRLKIIKVFFSLHIKQFICSEVIVSSYFIFFKPARSCHFLDIIVSFSSCGWGGQG